MAFFPQLSTGVSSQYPLGRRQAFRSVVNRMRDGRQIKAFDSGGSVLEIELALNGLTDAEMTELEQFFSEREGRRDTFGFLDPAMNLLQWSEDYLKPVWTRGPLLSISGGEEDPWGTLRASRLQNTAVAAQAAVQAISAPGGYRYCFSLWLSAAASTQLTLLATSGGFSQSQLVMVDQSWRRFSLSVELPSTTESIGFGWEQAAGSIVKAVGAQVDAQPAAAGYRKTTSRHGVYSKVRFAADTFSRVTRGVDDNGTNIKLFARLA